ncbi:MAG: 50S ribosomal protein L11 methyltransferase [Lysobacteraceae bacterium]
MYFDKTPSSTLKYHRSMLADTARVEAFRSAIFQTVKSGDVVLDLGTGTGLLSFLACEAGAARVYAIEAGHIVEAARLVCASNGYADRVTFINERSTKVELPELADVLVTETIGNLGLDENILGYAIDAQQRLLKKGARVIPAAMKLHLVPVDAKQNYEFVEAWSELVAGLDYSAVRSIAANNPEWVRLDAATFLGEPSQSVEISLSDIASGNFETVMTCRIAKQGSMCGLGGWFSARLNDSGTIAIDNAPGSKADNWTQTLLPFARPVEVFPGDVVEASLKFAVNASVIQWSATCSRNDGADKQRVEFARSKQSSFLGQMLSGEALRRNMESSTPQLSTKGMADRFILGLFDGSKSLGAIGRLVTERFPGEFRDEAIALTRVQMLSRQYGR